MKPDRDLGYNFLDMKAELDSCANRLLRNFDSSFASNGKGFFESLESFNNEYEITNIDTIQKEYDELLKNLNETNASHCDEYKTKYDKESSGLVNSMSGFFIKKFEQGEKCKRKLSTDIKGHLDKICDINIVKLVEELDLIIYNFKVDFEMKYIRDEYSKDDFNKVVRSFEHDLINDLRSFLVDSISDNQDIVSRHAAKSYDILDTFVESKKKKNCP